MFIIHKARGRGKTYDLIIESHKRGLRICCDQRHSKRYILDEAKKMGLKILEPIFYHDFLNDTLRSWHPDQRRILIDDLDRFLAFHFNYIQISGATINKRE